MLPFGPCNHCRHRRETGGQILHERGFDKGVLGAHVGSRHDLNGGGLVPERTSRWWPGWQVAVDDTHNRSFNMENMGYLMLSIDVVPMKCQTIWRCSMAMFHSDVQWPKGDFQISSLPAKCLHFGNSFLNELSTGLHCCLTPHCSKSIFCLSWLKRLKLRPYLFPTLLIQQIW